MSRHVSRGGLALLLLFLATGIAIFLFLAGRFGGPAIELRDPFLLRARVADTQALATRSDVRVRGVVVGHVRRIERSDGRALLTLALDGTPVAVHRDATLRIGTKTPLGEGYVDLDPGTSRRGALRSGATLAVAAVRPAVEIDEALQMLDAPARRHLRGTLRSWGAATASPRAAEQLAGATEELRRTIDAADRLGGELDGQGPALAAIVDGGGQVVQALADRRDRLRTLVRDGSRTLRAVAGRDRALRATLREAPRLLRTADATLAEARPLVREARPVVSALHAAAPDLAAAARALPAATDAVDRILAGADRLRRSAAPLLDLLPDALTAAAPAARLATPALANLTTMVRYFAPRKRTIAAWFSNTAAFGTNGDAKGRWARFFVMIDPATLLAAKSDLPTNAYTGPDDAVRNAPYEPGDFPRLRATPPPASPPASRPDR